MVVVYCWSAQGLSDDNVVIFKQIRALRQLLGKSLIIVGDFNNKAQEMVDAGWLGMLDVVPILPNVDTTFKNASDRVIDFILVSPDIQHTIVQLQPDLSTPWVHVGFSFAVLARPGEYVVNTIRHPAPIPLEWLSVGSVGDDGSPTWEPRTLKGTWNDLDDSKQVEN